MNLSHGVVVIHWVTSRHKNHIITRVITNTLARTCNVTDNANVNNAFSY